MSEPMLEARDIAVTFGGLKAVAGVSIDVHPGEVVGLIGPNGAGKSTFFNIISGTVRQDSGTIRFRGEDVSRAPVWKRARMGMARTFQLGGVVDDLTVLEHVVLGLDHSRRAGGARRNRKERISAAMEWLEGPRWRGRHHQLVGQLSAGYRREIEILRALASDPTLVLMDEPTVGLGMADRLRLTDMIRSFAEKGTAFLITDHDTDTVARVCDRVAAMSFGSRVAEGTAAEVMAHEDVIASYLGTRTDQEVTHE